MVEAFEEATAADHGQVVVDGRVVELPAYTAARRLLDGTSSRYMVATRWEMWP